ncbi:SWIB/MDM2 domain-containing protein [Methylobacterium sp. 174MFSha1.1]|uniref:SWIB/MDM2 domain-containing protein n=1 Tax=Methylobacterium sp. 174MFSha1.1 TaxID=1502749 RepID=UPI0008E3F61E|nr:SWIB/MDM2 domain-containing protein [Methylobacterium sp. 174MFSha1.1]SFV14799.1 SWIB/MDM2 domain-containing protein [Methylobacterium sp. 174MFSha1.1]
MAIKTTKKAETKAEPEAAAPKAKAAPKAAAKEAKDEAKDEGKDAAKGKKVAAPKSGDKPNALQKPLQPTPELAAIVGDSPIPRGEVVSKVWDYIRKHSLQNPENKREILADDKLKKVFGKDKATMFEMNKYLAQHLK